MAVDPLLAAVTGIAVVICTTVLIFKCVSSERKRRPEPPGPWCLPIVGYIPFLGMQGNKTLTKLAERYGDVFQVKLGTRKIVVVNGQRAVREALLNKGTDFAGRPDFFSYKAAGGFGFETYSPAYRTHKKLLLKSFGAFSIARRQELQEVALNSARMLLDVVKKASGEPVNPQPILYKATCAIMGYICYGKFFDADSVEVTTILNTASNFANIVAFGVICDFIPAARFLIGKRLEEFKKLMGTIREYSDKLASAHIETYNKEVMRDISDMFRKAADNLEDEEKATFEVNSETLKETLSGMFGAGFGTISATLLYGIMMMAIHQDVQAKVQEEIDNVIGADCLPQFDDMNDLPYVMAVITENYRIYSLSALSITHSTICDTELDGYFIAKDTPVIFNLYSANKDASVFPNPEKYDPMRYLTADGKLDASIVEKVIPYGLGIRRCGGEVIARLEIVLFFLSILQQCLIKPAPGHPLDPENYILTLGLSLKPFKVVFEPRVSTTFT